MRKYNIYGYLMVVFFSLFSASASAVGFLSQFSISPISLAGDLYVSNNTVETPFTAYLQISRGFNSNGTFEKIDWTVSVVYTKDPGPNPNAEKAISSAVKITESDFNGAWIYKNNSISCKLPASIVDGYVYLKYVAYDYHDGVRSSTPLTSYSTTKFKVSTSANGGGEIIPDTFIHLIPDVRTVSAIISKESNSEFICPEGTVMTGRMHRGDDNGPTQYEYATLKAVDRNGSVIKGGIVRIVPVFQRDNNSYWTKPIKESDGIWAGESSSGLVMIGRKHSGDENGYTSYMLGYVNYNGKPTGTIRNLKSEYGEFGNKCWETRAYEAEGIFFKTREGEVLVQRMHDGDEKKATFYRQESIYVIPQPPKHPPIHR